MIKIFVFLFTILREAKLIFIQLTGISYSLINKWAACGGLDALFEKPQIGFEIVLRPIELRKQAEIKDCYTITEIQKKFSLSNGALYNLIKRNNISKFSKGKFTYVAKKDIEAFIK